MRLSHDPLKISASFDDPNLVSRAGLVPVMALAERAGLGGLVRRHVRILARTGVYPEIKPLDIMHLASPYSAILSAVIFNALIIVALIPLALRGVRYRPGAVHAGVLPALVYLGERRPAGEGQPGAAGRAGPPGPAVARRGSARVHRRRLDAAPGLRP